MNEPNQQDVTNAEAKEPSKPVSARASSSSQFDIHNPRVQECLENYWKKNLRIMTVLLVIWASVSWGCGILLADVLNNIKMGGFPLGFWFSQQGSIMVFVLLILIYCLMLNRLDHQHLKELEAIKNEERGQS